MKKYLMVTVSIIILISVLVIGCSKSTTTTTTTQPPAPTSTSSTTTAPPPTTSSSTAITTTTTAPKPTTTTTTTATSTTTTGPQPVYGGTLRITGPSFPKVLGLVSEFAPADSIFSLPVLERLVVWDEQGNYIPSLAEKWTTDKANKTITWTLRKGVKFHDGTDFNADAVKWQMQMGIDSKRLTDYQYVDSLEVVDPYTLKMHLNGYTSMMVEDYGFSIMTSPTAYQKGGNTEDERKAWARANSVGTGPFRVTNFVRDTSIRYEKNPNYWRPGKPYLDAIEYRMIPDPLINASTLEAKQSDMWIDAGDVPSILNFQKKGLTVNWGPGMFFALLPNSNDPNSPTSKKEVREAIEYAIDRPALANMIGSGQYEPLTQIAPKKAPFYVPGYDPRPYNPTKAKQLLAAAGYPNGFKTKIMTTSTGTDAVAGMKANLDAVGIQVDVDIADLGRYFGEVFGAGWKDDLVWAASGINPSGTDVFIHYGPSPMTFKSPNIKKSPEYLSILGKALDAPTWNEGIPLVKDAVKQAGEDAMIIPVYRSVTNSVMQPYVHSQWYIIHGIMWFSQDDWMDKH